MKQFTEQLENIIKLGKSLTANAQYDDLSDQDDAQIQKFLSQARAAIERISGPTSAYVRDLESILLRKDFVGSKVSPFIGILESLVTDIQAGYLLSVSELLHSELFGDFLEMAEHLSKEGYKDAAAVLAGSTLEGHLRQLCSKHSIPINLSTTSGSQPKKADRMNADLTSSSAYSKLDQKSVTAWLDLRNNAAHGHYADYTIDQVRLMISGIRDFITRNPA